MDQQHLGTSPRRLSVLMRGEQNGKGGDGMKDGTGLITSTNGNTLGTSSVSAAAAAAAAAGIQCLPAPGSHHSFNVMNAMAAAAAYAHHPNTQHHSFMAPHAAAAAAWSHIGAFWGN